MTFNSKLTLLFGGVVGTALQGQAESEKIVEASTVAATCLLLTSSTGS